MSGTARLLVFIVVALASMAPSGCSDGIGMSVPSSGARWGGPGPGVIVAGGPR
jgi:hypothetical protein